MFVPPCRAGSRTTRATRSVFLACATTFVVLTTPALGSAQAARDPVAGTWSGRIGPSAQPNYPVTLNLRLDRASVRGTVSTADGSGEIRSGAYDTASSTLHLEVARVGESSISLVFDGVVVHGIATGRITKAQSIGTFVLTRDGASLSQSAGNAVTINRDALRSAADELMGNITRAAEVVPAQRFGWRPIGTVRTVAELLGHIVDASLYYCGRAAGRPVQWSDAVAEGSLDKLALIAKLNDANAQCRAAADAGSMEVLVENYGHANLHYGNLVTYIRLLGLVPPASR